MTLTLVSAVETAGSCSGTWPPCDARCGFHEDKPHRGCRCWVLWGAQHHCLQFCSLFPALALRCHLCSSFHPHKLCLEINKSWAPGCCTAVTPVELLPASLIPPGCLRWVRGSKCGRKGVSPEQWGCPRFAPRTPITWCRWDGCPPRLGIAGRDGQTQLPAEPRSCAHPLSQALAAVSHQQHHRVPELPSHT